MNRETLAVLFEAVTTSLFVMGAVLGGLVIGKIVLVLM